MQNSALHDVHKKWHDKNLSWARFDSTARATCQSSNKFGYSSGSAKDSEAFGLTFTKKETNSQENLSRTFQGNWESSELVSPNFLNIIF